MSIYPNRLGVQKTVKHLKLQENLAMWYKYTLTRK